MQRNRPTYHLVNLFARHKVGIVLRQISCNIKEEFKMCPEVPAYIESVERARDCRIVRYSVITQVAQVGN